MANVGPKMDWQTQQHRNNGGRRNNNNNNNDDDDNSNNTNITRDSRLHNAAREGNIGAVRNVLSSREGRLLISMQDDGLNLPLHLSVEHGRNDEVSKCLFDEHPEGCYALNRAGESPIRLALDTQNFGLVNYFIHRINSSSNRLRKTNLEAHLRSIASYAIIEDKQAMLEAIATPGVLQRCEQNQPPIIQAATLGRVAIVRSLMNERYRHSICAVNKYGETILHAIARLRNQMLNRLVPDLLRLQPEGETLLKKRNENNRRALAVAEESDNKEVAEMIKQKMKQLRID